MNEPRCTGTKTCTLCRENLSVLAFSSNPDSPDGLRSRCRSCEGEARKKADRHYRTWSD